MTQTKLDPVRYEIFYNKLFHALNEAKETIRHLSASPITRYAGEIAEAVYLPSGDSVVMAAGVLCHVNTVSRAIKHMINDSYADDVGFNPGDQFINNDAHIGGLHIPDMLLMAPFFYGGKHVGWVGTFTHIPEIGAIEPGGASPSARNFYHEGICLPCVKIVDKGEIRRDIFQMMLRAVRDPKAIAIDTKAKIAGNFQAVKGLTRIIEEFGLEFYETAMKKLYDDSKIQAEQRLRSFRPGKYRSRAYTDYSVGFETGLGVTEISFDVSKEGNVTLSAPVVSPERKGFNNLALPGAEALMFSTLMTQIFHDLRCNGGTFNSFKLDIPEGSMLRASETAAIGLGAIGVGLQSMASLNVAISLACYVAGMKESVIAGNSVLTALFFGGMDQFGRRSANTVTDGLAGGTGARLTKDGVDSSVFQPNPWTDNPDMETIEMSGPLLYLARNHVPNSGGFGKFRGGTGIESILLIHDSPEIIAGTRGQGGLVTTTYGLYGGYPPSRSVVSVNEDNNLKEIVAEKGSLPHRIEDIEKLITGKHEYLFPSSPGKLRKEGTIISFRNWGGGGLGDPIERDPKSIAADIRNEVATLDVAEKVYAVSIDRKTLEIDDQKTEKLREERREERLNKGLKAKEYLKVMIEKRNNRDLPQPVLEFFDEIIPFSPGFRKELEFEAEFCDRPDNETPAPIQPEVRLFDLTPYLKVVEAENQSKVVVCRECGHVYCEATENYKLYCLIYDSDPKEIQPGILGPDKDWMIYREFYCPGCGTQVDVEGTPEGTPILHSIEVDFSED
jgi:N-methylhydantoinase B/oxoprolinase/acetone carboxylase alpha subunit